MTTTAATMSATSSSRPSRTPLLAVLGVATSAVLTAAGTFADATGNSSAEHGMREWLVVVGITVAAAAVVFGLVVRTAARGHAGRRSVALGVLAVLSFGVFWTGLPAVLAAGALACALTARDTTGRWTHGAVTAVALAGVAVVAAAVLAIVG